MIDQAGRYGNDSIDDKSVQMPVHVAYSRDLDSVIVKNVP